MARWLNEHKYDDAVRAAHTNYPGVPVAIIKAIIGQESGFQERARRQEYSVGDASIGLMQLLMSTAKGLGFAGPEESLFNPNVNVFYGTRLLSQLFSKTGNWPDAISAYNGGIRPNLGFGRRATNTIIVCLDRDSKGNCIKQHETKPGEYSNQEYVDRVLVNASYFGFDHATGEPPTERGELYKQWASEHGAVSFPLVGGTALGMLAVGGLVAWLLAKG